MSADLVGKAYHVELPALTESVVNAFKASVKSRHAMGLPPTLASRFRESEFEILKSLGVDLRGLLHTEQTYQFLSELPTGKPIAVDTAMTQYRERRGMHFVTIESDVVCAGKTCTHIVSNFVVREVEKP